jgi:protein tyrosine/serine phosphatase
MAKLLKMPRRAFRRRMLAVRNGLAERSPAWARRRLGPLIDHADMLLIDHGIFRSIYANRHQIAGDAWRSSQPSPRQIAQMAALGIRTIVNLRGERDCGAYRLQVAACRKHGIAMEELTLKSRAAPTRQQIHAAKALFARIQYPMLMHCKSGADRAGLGSALFMILREGKPVAEAMWQLSPRYGHIKQADTGIIDFFFERYLVEAERSGVPFLQWVDAIYDAEKLAREFRGRSWANTLVNSILRRE